MQKILCVGTADDSMRSAIEGWGVEDGDLVKEHHERHGSKYTYMNLPVGLVGSPKCPTYPTVLHAIGDGWKLLGPPTKWSAIHQGKEIGGYTWWLVKD